MSDTQICSFTLQVNSTDFFSPFSDILNAFFSTWMSGISPNRLKMLEMAPPPPAPLTSSPPPPPCSRDREKNVDVNVS